MFGRSLSVSSTFSLNSSNRPTEELDDFMDSQPSEESDSSNTTALPQANMLNQSMINYKTLTQIDANCFVIRWSVFDSQYWNTIAGILNQVLL